MNLWIKIENFLNRILGFLFGGLGKFLSKLTPKQIPLFIAQSKRLISKFFTLFKKTCTTAFNKVRENSKSGLQGLKKIDVSSVATNIKNEMQNMKGKSPASLAVRPFQLFFQKLSSMEPKKALGFLALGSFTALSLFSIIFSSSRIYDKIRTPSSIEEVKIPPRPVYYKIDQKQVNFSTVKVPIYAQGKNDIKFMTADFELQMSNRLSVIYFREHETMIRDHLINHVEPMDPIFTMEKEGKTIIKDKLKKEINVFLEKSKVEGKVDEVNLIYLLGT
ncbi:MAG: flagellar basal body-associated FliL family protein [Bacteriovoracaceae bacterium]